MLESVSTSLLAERPGGPYALNALYGGEEFPMLGHTKIGTLIVASTLMLASPAIVRSQSAARITQTDPRW